MFFCFALPFANFKVNISIKGKLTLLLVPLSSSAGGREGGGNALNGDGSGLGRRSRQLSPGFHFSKGEGGGIRVSYPLY